jgi:pyruvate-formate lyase-activating enzyme
LSIAFLIWVQGLLQYSKLESFSPITILAFFPEYRMKAYQSPSVTEMVKAYQRVKATGLKNIRIGNAGVFARTKEDQKYLMENVDEGVY